MFSRSSKGSSAHPRDPVLAAWFGGGGTASGMTVTPASALSVSTVWACVRVIAESVAVLPLVVYQRLDPRGKEKAPAHPLYRVLHERPNRWQTPFEFKEMMTAHTVLRGNAYAEIISTDQNPAAELVPLHPDRVMPFRAPDGRLAYRHQPEKGPQRILLQEEVLHLRGLSSDGVMGHSPVRLHREAIGLALAGEAHAARVFGNSAEPGGAIKVPAVLEDEAARELVTSWERRHKGVDGTRRVAILDGGMEWQQTGMTNEDAQFLQSRKLQRSEIASIFRVPPHKIGDLERATFSNIEQQSIDFVTDTLMPWLVRWQEAIGRDLLTEESRQTYFAGFIVQALLRGDAASRAKWYAAMRQWGAFSANDIRELEDMNPIEGGDVYLSPANMTPADLLQQMVDEAVERAASPPPALPLKKPNGDGRTHGRA